MSELTRIGRNAYPHNNRSIELDYLEEIILRLSCNCKGKPIGEIDGGYQDVIVKGINAIKLDIPKNAVAAQIYVELGGKIGRIIMKKDAKTVTEVQDTSSIIMRYKIKGKEVSKDSGIPLKDGAVIEVEGAENLKSFGIINIDGERVNYLRVQFYASKL